MRILYAIVFALVALAFAVPFALADATVPHEPTPEPTYRALRSDYVRQWTIFNDTQTDGVLNPGDTRVETFANWWSPVSSHSSSTYRDHQNVGPGHDLTSAPMNWATYTLDPSDPNRNNPDFNYWLPREQHTMSFYMTYSQFDNNDWATTNYGDTPLTQQIVRQRNLHRNGWALGWVANDYNYQATSSDYTGSIAMDVYVHDGKLDTNIQGFGPSLSNPHVGMSNDVDYATGLDHVGSDGGFHPAEFDESTQSYSWAQNQLRMEANGLNATDLDTLANSMEVKESDPYNLIGAPLSARTPSAILAGGPKAPDGSDYTYGDAFQARQSFPSFATDGGVISGLGGFDAYDSELNNWADQQVIRIDVDPQMLLEGGIDKLVFYDFGGSDPGSTTSDQVDPRMLVFYADDLGNLFYDGPAGRVYFPENRIFIAMVNQIPEPASLALLCLGGAVVMFRRSKSKR
jgi:hypothetical protein